jgi:hypothetical protein
MIARLLQASEHAVVTPRPRHSEAFSAAFSEAFF